MNGVHTKIIQKRLASRYACAFLNIFEDEFVKGSGDALCAGARFFSERKKAIFFMQLGSIPRELVRTRLITICTQLGISQTIEALITLLLEHKRIFLLELVFKQLCKELHRRRNEVECEITTVDGLSQKDKQTIVDVFEKKLGKKLLCTYKENPALIAGIRICTEQVSWEYSIGGRLRYIYNTLKR